MLVTINTDASFIDGFGGYAFWIVCNEGKIQKAGKIKQKINNNHTAEIMAIANALHTLKNSRFSNITKVIINTDSQDSIGKLKKQCNKFCKIADECHFTMMEISIKNGFSIRDISKMFEFKHVKAHTSNKDSDRT